MSDASEFYRTYYSPALGAGGLVFESLRPDHSNRTESQIPRRCLAFLFSARFHSWGRFSLIHVGSRGKEVAWIDQAMPEKGTGLFAEHFPVEH